MECHVYTDVATMTSGDFSFDRVACGAMQENNATLLLDDIYGLETSKKKKKK